MRRILAILIAALALGACSGGPSTVDPYQVVDKALDASWNLVQVNVGLSGVSDGSPVSVDPSAIQLTIDTKGGRGAVHLSVPTSALGSSAADLGGLGLTGSTIDVDVVYDGQALYAKGPLVTAGLTALLAQSGQSPGDLSGWVRLATKDDITALIGQLGSLGAGAIPSMPIPSAHTADSIKQSLADSGVTLAYVATETKNGVNAYHLSASIDASKLAANPELARLGSLPIPMPSGGAGQVQVSGDLWVATDSSRVVEIDLHVLPGPGASPGASGADHGDLVIQVSEPANDSALQAPPNATPVSISSLLGPLLQLVGGFPTTP